MKDLKPEQDARIDLDHLEIEAAMLPQIILEYSNLLIELINKKAKIKRNTLTLRASTELEIRLSPEEYGIIGKLTEPGIKAALELDEDIAEIENESLELDHQYNIAKGNLEIIRDKKKAIELAITLFIAQYWSMSESTKIDEASAEILRQRESERQNMNLEKKKRGKGK